MPDLLTIRPEESNARSKIARALITGLLDEAVRVEKVTTYAVRVLRTRRAARSAD